MRLLRITFRLPIDDVTQSHALFSDNVTDALNRVWDIWGECDIKEYAFPARVESMHIGRTISDRINIFPHLLAMLEWREDHIVLRNLRR